MTAKRDASGRFIKGSGGNTGGGVIRDTDRGYTALLGRMAEKAQQLTVGLHEAEGDVSKESRTGAGDGDGDAGGAESKAPPATLAEVGSYHEFGLGVPRRSFIADWADENRSRHEADLRKMAKAVVAGKVDSIETGLARLGNLYAGEVQKRIADGIPPPLEQSTVDRKGSSVPLIDIGQLRTAIAPYLNGSPLK